MTSYEMIHCEHHKELSLIGSSSCSVSGDCIYGNYQVNINGIKGCKVNGHIDLNKNIPENKRKVLLPRNLETTVTITV